MDQTLVRKITIKNVWGDIKRPAEGDKPVEVMHVLGIVNGIRELQDKFKPGQLSFGLRGQFEAANAQTGEVFVAPECFLPEPYHSMLVEQIKRGDTDIGVALSISYKYAKTQIGYEYVTKPHVKPTGIDILADLRSSLPQLAAPVKDKGKKAA